MMRRSKGTNKCVVAYSRLRLEGAAITTKDEAKIQQPFPQKIDGLFEKQKVLFSDRPA